jgi:hypothetical protein
MFTERGKMYCTFDYYKNKFNVIGKYYHSAWN